jgi:hypothetical protein
MNTYSVDKAVTIRYPSTANLMIDSDDRDKVFDASGFELTTPWNFLIRKSQNIQNGFFSRVGTTEVVLEWCLPNVSNDLSNNFLSFDISGTGAETFAGTINVNLENQILTVAQALDQIVDYLNTVLDAFGSTIVFSVTVLNASNTAIDISGGVFKIENPQLAPLATQLSLLDLSGNPILATTPLGDAILVGKCADLRPYRYIDFVSDTITYAQDVKDGSTAPFNFDVLCRWYFSEDVPEEVDSYGYPILMGYRHFTRRRLYNPPKQIKWDNNLPLGNLRFQVYGDNGQIIPRINTATVGKSNWLMTLQLSEN